MGCSPFYGWLMGIVIDGGFIAMKVIDCLDGKFSFSTMQKVAVKGIMVACLTVSAALNASQFLRHAANGTGLEQGLAVSFAVFISVFVFAMFYVGASMLVRCEAKSKEDEQADPVTRLLDAAKELKPLQTAAGRD